jgi:hypothetical protein
VIHRAAWWVATAAFALVGWTMAEAAQVGGKPVIGGNPTPGTAQPEPPNPANRIGLTGCLQAVPNAAPPADDNTPTSTRFVLTGVERTAGAAARPPASGSAATSGSYRLEGLDSLFSPFVGTRVEIAGEPRESKTSGDPPTLVVEFVQKAASTCSGLASAQTATGRIEGTLSSARAPLPDAEVRVRNIVTGQVVVTTTSQAGRFSVAVDPGTYELFAAPAGYIQLARRQIEVRAGQSTPVDATLADNANAGTPGEIFFLFAREGHQPPSGPTPRTADGRPDLSGVWLPGADLEPEIPPYQPWAAAVARERGGNVSDDPRAHCLPTGVVRQSGLDLVKFVHTPRLLVVLVEGSVPGVRQVFLDGRGHPPDVQPTWLGHSVGTWEGDTLVIDSVGFNDRGWLDITGRPQTERLHVIERYRRRDLGHLELEITVDDPGAYTRPWKVRRLLQLAPNEEIREYICNENNKTEHFVPGAR